MNRRITNCPTRLIWPLLGVLLLLFSCTPTVVSESCGKLNVQSQIPGPVLLNVSVDGVARKTDSLFLEASDEVLSIELQEMAVDSYFFRLNIKGLNPCGIATPYPQMHFTFLPGGTHTLEYWIQKGGAYSAHQKLNFYVKEALTEKGWFYPSLVAYILLIAGAIVYFWTLYNIRQRLKIQHIRSRIAADLHDEISSDLSSIAISMTTLERRGGPTSTASEGLMLDIKRTLAETQNNLLDTVWAIRPEKDTSGELFQRMQRFAEKMFATSETLLSFLNTIPPNKPIKINMEQRHTVFRIYKEAIHNIYKHAKATEVTIKIYPHPEGVCMEIRDNGVGFDPTVEHDGNGVSNYHWRAKESFIDFQLETAPGKGCSIKMMIPQF